MLLQYFNNDKHVLKTEYGGDYVLDKTRQIAQQNDGSSCGVATMTVMEFYARNVNPTSITLEDYTLRRNIYTAIILTNSYELNYGCNHQTMN